ncbi:MAG: hypothetical protein U0936_07365 [Planctomycetaceae bacterium]
MPLKAAEWFAKQVSQSLIDATQPTWKKRRVFTLDGCDDDFATGARIAKGVSDGLNQPGTGVWPVMLLTVCHELSGGAALVPEVRRDVRSCGCFRNRSDQAKSQRIATDSVVMADAGFGIFNVAFQIRQAGHVFLLRMTQQRFDSLKKKSELMENGDHHKVWSHRWTPSAKERTAHPDLPQDTMLEIRLHEIVINEHLTLLLATDTRRHA